MNNFTCPNDPEHQNVSFQSIDPDNDDNNIMHQTKQANPKSGKCYLMCPKKEFSLRLNRNQYHNSFEVDLNGKYTKYSLIKEYIRSSAGQQININNVRPSSVLTLTLQYLMNITLNNTNTSFIDRFSFLEDRIRAIIKDIYVQSLFIYNKPACIQLLEVSVRFRIISHVFLCHLDQQYQQSDIESFCSSSFTKLDHKSKFLNMNLNEKAKQNKYYYSSTRNLCHLSNIFNHLFGLYKSMDFQSLTKEQQDDQIEIYNLAVFHELVQGQSQNIPNYTQIAKQVIYNRTTPKYIRKHPRIKTATALIDAYQNLNKTVFFKVYKNKLSMNEKAILYPILDHFRLCYIKKMCRRKCVRMPPWNPRYPFKSFVTSFGFYDDSKDDDNKCMSKDAMDFLSCYGRFDTNNIERIIESGLTMDDFGRIKLVRNVQRFASRNEFLFVIDNDKKGMQKILQRGFFNNVDIEDFYAVFEKIEQCRNENQVEMIIKSIINSNNS